MLKLGFVVVGSLFLMLALQTVTERQFASSSHKPNSSPNAPMKEYVEQPKCRLKRVNTPLTINHLNPTALTFNDLDYDTGDLSESRQLSNPNNYPGRWRLCAFLFDQSYRFKGALPPVLSAERNHQHRCDKKHSGERSIYLWVAYNAIHAERRRLC